MRDGLPLNVQFRLYSEYEITKAQAPAKKPNSAPIIKLDCRFISSRELLPRYSPRMATSGSMRDARRAGT